MENCSGCETTCPALLYVTSEIAAIDKNLKGLNAAEAAGRQAEDGPWGDTLAPNDRDELLQFDEDTLPEDRTAGSLRGDFAFAARLAERHRQGLRAQLTIRRDSLELRAEIRQNGCLKGPRTARTLGFIGAKQTVCGSGQKAHIDGLPDRG